MRTKFEKAITLLLDAAFYAEQTSGDRWEFAVEIGELRQLGLCNNDLRFLIRRSFVEHAIEIRTSDLNGRKFQAIGDLTFTDRTCFIITTAGLSTFHVKDETVELWPTHELSKATANNRSQNIPSWDINLRQLSFDGSIVKEFKCPAINQETILSVFQEDGWPARIDDPLSPTPTIDVQRRLSDTIKCLNRSQKHNLVHFRGDGTGFGVIWEPTRRVS